MTVDDEVVVSRVLVLADASFEQRSSLHAGEAARQIATRFVETGLTDDSLAGGRIERGATRVVGQLEAASLIPGNPVHEMVAVIRPHRDVVLGVSGLTRGSTEEEDILLADRQVRTNSARKELAEAGTAGKKISISFDVRAVGECELLPRPIVKVWRGHSSLPVFPAFCDKLIDHGLDRCARQQVTALRLVDAPGNSTEADLRPAARHLSAGKLFERDAGLM